MTHSSFDAKEATPEKRHGHHKDHNAPLRNIQGEWVDWQNSPSELQRQ